MGVLLATDQVPEVDTAPVSLAFLLGAEMTTAVLTVLSGAAPVARRAWGHRSFMVASGMMLYAITNYLGVLAEGGQTALVALFGAPYQEYMRTHPRFLPLPRRPRQGDDGRRTCRPGKVPRPQEPRVP